MCSVMNENRVVKALIEIRGATHAERDTLRQRRRESFTYTHRHTHGHRHTHTATHNTHSVMNKNGVIKTKEPSRFVIINTTRCVRSNVCILSVMLRKLGTCVHTCECVYMRVCVCARVHILRQTLRRMDKG